MVRTTSFSRPTGHTMASKASLLILLSMTIAYPALAVQEDPLDLFPTNPPTNTDDQAVLEKIKRACPPFGNPNERFSVTVLGTTSPVIGGCVSMVPPNHHIVPSFNLWLGSLKFGGGGGCGEKNMDHYLFECMEKHPSFTKEDTLEGWYVMLYDRTARWSERQDYRCALYETINEDPPMIKMVISANQSCKGLSERMEQSEHTVPEGFRHFVDGSVALHFTKDLQQTPLLRKKRSEVQGGGCRFPDWSQGSWTNLKIDGSLARYNSALDEKDDVDYSQESDYGKDGDSETTGGEHFIQRSQRQKRWFWDPVTTTQRYRDPHFENPPKAWDPMEPYTKTTIHFGTTQDPSQRNRIRRSVDEDLDENYESTEDYNEIVLKDNQVKKLMQWSNKMKTLPKFKKYIDGKDGDSETTGGEHLIQRSQRQKRWFWDPVTTTQRYRDPHFENPPKAWDPMEPYTKTTIHFGTTQDPSQRNRIRRSVDEDLDENYESTEDYNEIVLKDNQVKKLMQWSNKMKTLPKIKKYIDGKDGDSETTGGEHFIQRSQRQKRWFWDPVTTTQRYRDPHFENPPKAWDPMEPYTKTTIHFGTTQDPSQRNRIRRSVDEDLDENYESTEDYNEIVLKDNQVKKLMQWSNKMKTLPKIKKYIDGKDGDSETTGGEHFIQRSQRQKRWFWDPVTTTQRYRDPHFENPPKAWDPMEPYTKTTIHFGTTQDPSQRNRIRRSVDEDLDENYESTEDNEEEALNKVKILDQFNRYMRWLNIVNAIMSIKNHRLDQSNVDIKEKEYEIFPEDTPVPSPVKYLKFAEMLGIQYKKALTDWRSMEREYRKKEAEIAFSAYPGQNHPDIVMKDFDQTFDGIEYDFDPMYPEGTADDPIAYRAITLPSGYQIKPQQSRRTTYEQKKLRDVSKAATLVSQFRAVRSNPFIDRTHQVNTPSLNKRTRRSSTQHNQQHSATTTFSWSCEMQVDNDEKHLQPHQNGVKFLTYGGRIVENNVLPGNDQHNENNSEKTYGCLWLVLRGSNLLEFSLIGIGVRSTNQTLEAFAKQLCSNNRANGKDTGVRNEKKLIPHHPYWITETRTDDKKLVPVGCPVPPGIVFYGVVPAPPPPAVSSNKAQPIQLRLCARLVSSADDCTTGPTDHMKYTVSECVEQDSSLTGTPQSVVAPQTIFEASRGHTVGGSWRRNKRHSTPTDTSTVASSVDITSTSSNMPILQFSSHNPPTGAIDNITDHQTTGSTATFWISMNPSSTGIQPSTTMDPAHFTTTTATTLSTATSSTLPLSSPHEATSPERQLPSLSKSSTTVTTPFTSTATVPTTSTNHPVTDYHYRQQQQSQQQPNNNDYYYSGRQQHYPPPPPGSTGTDNNYYYLHQQHWPQQQTQTHWLPQQHPITANEYSNGYQYQTMDSGDRRIGDYHYRQQQQNYHNHQHNNDRQQQMPQPPRNSSLTLQHPTSGSWNIRGERPLYISSGGGGDNNRDALVPWNSSTSVSSSDHGGWTTAAQQYWWYQQQQQRWQEQEQQKQQLQQQKRQQQTNRGLGGILSLAPVPLPPLHTEQGAITFSVPTPLPLHPRRQQKPSNYFYLPTLTTKTSFQSYQLRSKSESRYYQEREYQCLGQWTEPQQQISPVAGEKSVMLTYTYLKRLNPITKEGAQYECFVGTPIPNDEGLNPETTTTILLTEAGTNTKCSRLSDPYRSGMKLVGTKIKKEGTCKGSAQPAQDTAGGSWYSLKPQPISPFIPGAENGGGAWYASPPIPMATKSPTTMMPILTGRHTGGNGATFTSRQNDQTRRPQLANPPPKTNNNIRTVADKTIVILLAVILFAGQRNNIAPRFFN